MSDVAAAPARVSLPEHCPFHPERACIGTCERCGVFLCVACRHPQTKARCYACAPRVDLGQPTGIGGWLLLSLLGLFLHPLRLFAAVVVPLLVGARQPGWDGLLTPGPWPLSLGFRLVTTGAIGVYTLILIVGFLQTRRWLPQHMQYFHAAGFLITLAQAVAQATLPDSPLTDLAVRSYPSMLHAAFSLGENALWMGYFRVSERVRSTFVR
ncbi:DUF2569 family protein [Myxococcaceae bacterium GXIMD 01537]